MIKSGNRVPRYKNTYLCTYVRMRYLNSGDSFWPKAFVSRGELIYPRLGTDPTSFYGSSTHGSA